MGEVQIEWRCECECLLGKHNHSTVHIVARSKGRNSRCTGGFVEEECHKCGKTNFLDLTKARPLAA